MVDADSDQQVKRGAKDDGGFIEAARQYIYIERERGREIVYPLLRVASDVFVASTSL